MKVNNLEIFITIVLEVPKNVRWRSRRSKTVEEVKRFFVKTIKVTLSYTKWLVTPQAIGIDPLSHLFVRFSVPMNMEVTIIDVFREDTTFWRITTIVWVDEGYCDLVPHSYRARYAWFDGDLFRPLYGFRGPPRSDEDADPPDSSVGNA